MGKYGQCKKDANGHTKCLDISDGYKKWKYCRKSAWGKVTCSDRDHSDWWAEENTTETSRRYCRKNAWGNMTCSDDENRWDWDEENMFLI